MRLPSWRETGVVFLLKNQQVMKPYLYLSILFCLSLLMGCNDTENGPEVTFDRAEMLENMADNIILPRLQAFQSEATELHAAVNAFAQDVNAENLAAARSAWADAAEDWQYVSAFGFGPGDLSLGPIGSVLGTFPADASAIEQAIAAQDFSLNNFRRDVRGLYALEYLLYGPQPNQDNTLSFYQASEGAARLAYLQAVSDNLNTNTGQVVSEWQSGYRSSFIENDGTSAGSSAAQLFNAFSQDFEVLKNFKVGLPAGNRSGQTSAEPTKVEAYYSGMSRQLLDDHFNSVVSLWEGGDGPGFREYLLSVEGGPALVQATEEQIIQVEQDLASLPDEPLSQLIEQDAASVDNLYTELQKLTRFFKSDMSSLLGIAITYNSGDGD